MTVACVELKITLPNVETTGASGTSAISKMDLFMVTALHWKSFTFVADSSIIDRRYYAM